MCFSWKPKSAQKTLHFSKVCLLCNPPRALWKWKDKVWCGTLHKAHHSRGLLRQWECEVTHLQTPDTRTSTTLGIRKLFHPPEKAPAFLLCSPSCPREYLVTTEHLGCYRWETGPFVLRGLFSTAWSPGMSPVVHKDAARIRRTESRTNYTQLGHCWWGQGENSRKGMKLGREGSGGSEKLPGVKYKPANCR